ncbi:MATE family efflux transporter [Corynebacterium sp. H78]|uniref:MATE family efflux transporter n=1 Tax=Corynebacterium sp. H78 TaxID=3133417 RepID=UPI00309957DF
MLSRDDTEVSASQFNVTARTILSLALPALGVLAAPPLYLLLDTAVIGRLGATELAALAAGSTIFAMVTTQLTFLAYGTTARASRAFGRGDTPGVVREGLQATWVAAFVGMVLMAIVATFAGVFTSWLTPLGSVATDAARWLSIASIGIPLTLLTQAGNGWLRGLQDTRRPLIFVLCGLGPAALTIVPLVAWLGLIGSAVATVAGETITAALFLRELVKHTRHHEIPLGPDSRIIKEQLVLGRDLIVRSLAFQVAFLSAAAVAGRISEQALGGHQILLQLWNLLSLLLDSLAIAAQTLVGAALGFGSIAIARWTSRRVVAWSTAFALFFAVVFAAGFAIIPALFSADPSVQDAIISGPWWLLVAMIPIGGIVFALDGVLLGAGDAAFLRNATVTAVVLGFLPPVWATYFFDWGLTGIWCGLLAFLFIRLVFVVARYRGNSWHKDVAAPSEQEQGS